MRLDDGVRVGDVPEEEGVAGHGGADGAAVLELDDLTELLYSHENLMDTLVVGNYRNCSTSRSFHSPHGRFILNGFSLG